MQTLGVVALSALAGIFLILLLAGLGVMVYLAAKIQKSIQALSVEMQKFSAENRAATGDHEQQLAKILDNAKSTMVSIKQEMRGALQSSHETVKSMVDRIKGNELQAASARIIGASIRLEKIASALQGLLLEQQESEIDKQDASNIITGPWPADRAEEYAPTSPAPTIYDKPRPEDVLISESDEDDRVPVGL